MATERITIVVDEKGSVTVKKSFDELGQSATKADGPVNKLRGSMINLRSAFAGLVGALSLGAFVSLADTFTNMQNRMQVVTSSATQLNSAMDATYAIAQMTMQGWEGVATIYARTAQASTQLGLTQGELTSFTYQLAQATALSGVSAESANAALIQLSQGLASGTLRGEELNSVLEQLPYAANVIAEGFNRINTGANVTAGGLRELAEAGTLTPKVLIDAFRVMSTSIQADFDKLTPTIGMGLTTIQNGFLNLVGSVQNSTGAFSVVATALVVLGNNLDIVAIALAPIAAGLLYMGASAVVSAGAAGLGAVITAATALAMNLTTSVIPAIANTATSFIRMAASNPVAVIAALTVAVIAGGIAWVAYSNNLFGAADALDGFVEAGKKKLEEFTTYMQQTIEKATSLKSVAEELRKAMGSKELMGSGKSSTSGAVPIDATKAAEQIKDALGDGGASSATKMETGVARGGQQAANAIEQAGQKGASALGGQGSNLYDLWSQWGDAFISDVIDAGTKTIGQMIQELQDAQVEVLKAQADMLKAQADSYRSGGSGSSGGGGGGIGGGSSSGGSGFGSSYSTRSYSAQASGLGNPVSVSGFKSEGQAKEENGTVYNTIAEAIKSVMGDNSTTIVNNVDAQSSLDALSTREGNNVIYNSIAADPDRIRAALGIGG